MAGDTFVLRFSDKSKPEMHTYVLFNQKRRNWMIRGITTSQKKNPTYFSHYMDHTHDVYEFLCMIYSSEKNVTIDLLNYYDLPTDEEEITFDLLEEGYEYRHMENISVCVYELENTLSNIKDLKKMLRILYNSYNFW